MSVAIGAQGVDLSQSMLFMGFEPLLLDDAGRINEGGSLNYPWLIQLSTRMGNAYTEGLARTANVLCEIESWEGQGGGGNQNWQGAGGHGAIGGISIWW
jgi:hypothetical protein